jgi:hypothetical protein
MSFDSNRYPLGIAVLWLALAGLGNAALAAPPAPRCVCRYAGKDYTVGQCVSMATPSGQRLAYCGFVLNNTAWKFTPGACGIASRKMTPRPRAGATPAGSTDREIAAVLSLR